MAKQEPMLLDRARRGLERLFGTSRRKQHVRAQGPRPAPAAPSSSEPGNRGLKALLANRTALTVGRLNLIGLEELRAALGSNAARFETRIQLAVPGIIRKHLSKDDIITPFGDSAYVVVFANLDVRHAQMKCAAIADDIKQWFLGCNTATVTDVVRQVIEIASDDIAGRSDLEAVFMSLGDAEIEGPSADAPALPAEEARRDAPAPAAEPATERQGPRARASEAPEVRYEPVWDTKSETLLFFRPIIAKPKDAHWRGDLITLRRVHRDLNALVERGRRFPVLMHVDSATLVDAACRANYLHALRDVPDVVRRLMTIDIPGNDGTPARLLVATFGERIRTMGARVAVRWTLDSAPVEVAKRLGARIVTLDMSETEALDKGTLQRLERFALLAGQNNLEAALFGARSVSMATLATTAGFRFISGPAVHAPVTALENVVRFAPLDLFENAR